MPRDTNRLNVFVSSTSEDLQAHRSVARQVILDLRWFPVMMEHFGSAPEQTVEACLEELANCDLMLLIVAFRQGWVPSTDRGGGDDRSITALELEFARKRNIPVLAMLANPSWPGNLWEQEQSARESVDRFRSDLNLPAEFFDHESMATRDDERLPSFRAKVRGVLVRHKERLLQNAKVRFSESSSGENLEFACKTLIDGKVIPFLGSGVNGDGPLSSLELARSLVGDAWPHETPTLATASEFRERKSRSRHWFLEELLETIEALETDVPEPPKCYDLLTQVDGIRLVVTATCDRLLEQHLRKSDKSFVVVSHIMRSWDGEHDGKILVTRDGEDASIQLADALVLPEVDYWIYRPLGSPFLHHGLDPDLEIDTVVITESDHLTFLGRLEHQHTQIPQKFVKYFQRTPILFVGYALDLWQYRLVMQVFHTIGIRDKRGSILAVRAPETPMEKIAWKALGADLIPIQPDEFALQCRRTMEIE